MDTGYQMKTVTRHGPTQVWLFFGAGETTKVPPEKEAEAA